MGIHQGQSDDSQVSSDNLTYMWQIKIEKSQSEGQDHQKGLGGQSLWSLCGSLLYLISSPPPLLQLLREKEN
jgi:hypothetical protein